MERAYETLIVILLISIVGFLAWYAPYGMSAIHDYPIAISSGDANSRLSETEWIRDSQQYSTLPPWFSDYKGAWQPQPPLHETITAIISGMTGFETWDVFYFLGVLVWIGTAIAFYLLFSRVWNDSLIGVIAAFLIVFPLQEVYRYQFMIGMYHTHYTIVFYALSVFLTASILQEHAPSLQSPDGWKKHALLGLLLGTQFLMHSSETVILSVALGVVLLAHFFLTQQGTYPLKETLKARFTQTAKTAAVIGIVFVVVIAFYVPLFWGNFIEGSLKRSLEGQQLGVPILPPPWEPSNTLLTFLPVIFIVVFLLGAFLCVRTKKFRALLIIWVTYALVDYILSQFGIGQYYISIRGRNMFYLMSYPILAIGIAGILMTLKNMLKGMAKWELPTRFLVWGAVGVMVLLLVVQGLGQDQRQGLFSPETYQGMAWIRDNTPPQSRVFCAVCNQYIGLPTHRVIMEFDINSESMGHFASLLMNQTQNRTFMLQYSGYSDLYLVREGVFSWKSMVDSANITDTRDLCGFDYYALVPFLPQSQQMIQTFAQRLVAKGSQVVYANNGMAVVKNAHVGGDCI